MPKLLENRVAVITGAGNGIGRAEAIGLARQVTGKILKDIGYFLIAFLTCKQTTEIH